MTAKAVDAPHIRHHESTRTLMIKVLLAILFLYLMPLFYYGPRVIALAGASVSAALLADLLGQALRGQRPNPRDLSALVTGLLIPLLMPASIDYRVVVVAAVFGIVVAKHPFGGVGHNVFNPAAAGFSFAAICFGDQIWTYPSPRNWLPLWGELEFSAVNSPAFTLKVGGIPSYDLVEEMLLGNFPGPMGATNILVIVACLIFLVLCNTVRWELPVSFLATAALFALLFPQGGGAVEVDMATRLHLLACELMSGMLLIGGVFMLGDPVTTPKRNWSRVAFGVVSGVVVMLFRRYGRFEEEFTFALLLMNAAVWAFDMLGERLASAMRRKKLETGSRPQVQEKG